MSDDDLIRRVAAALWKAESVDAGVPQSVTDGRTPEAFAERSEWTRAKWEKLAGAAIRAIPATDARADALREAASRALAAWTQTYSGPMPSDEAKRQQDFALDKAMIALRATLEGKNV